MEARAQDLPVTKELIDDENPHKFAIYWVSGIYKVFLLPILIKVKGKMASLNLRIFS